MIRPAQLFGVVLLLFNFNFNSLVCFGVKHNQLKTTRTHRNLKKSRRKSSFKKQAGAYRSKRSQDGVKEQKKGSNDRDTNTGLDWNSGKLPLKNKPKNATKNFLAMTAGTFKL